VKKPPSPYRVLKLKKSATPAEVEAAYRAAVRAAHPDRGGTAAAFERVRSAYRVLSDPAARAHYDRTGEARPPAPDQAARQALTVLAALFQQVVVALAKAGRKPAQEDLAAHLRDAVKQSRQGLGDQRRNLESVARVLADAAGRFETAGEANALDDLTRAHLAEVRGRLDGLAADEAAHEKALELLAAYTFRHAARPGRGVTFGAATTTFAWEA
jgi:curved DNA-binding protein CbpA